VPFSAGQDSLCVHKMHVCSSFLFQHSPVICRVLYRFLLYPFYPLSPDLSSKFSQKTIIILDKLDSINYNESAS
jgi:hypothetical protein